MEKLEEELKKKVLSYWQQNLLQEVKKQGRVRLSTIDNAKRFTIITFIKNNVMPGSTVVTDGWKGYSPLAKAGFNHDVKLMKDDKKLMPHVHTVFAWVKRWILGTYQGAVKEEYLQFYLNDVFRFNRRNSKSRGKLFRRLTEQAVMTPLITQDELSPYILPKPTD
jgi:transposase-like protein